MHHTTTVNVQKFDCKKQSWEIRTSLTPQHTKPCRGCGRHSHLNRLGNRRDYPAAKMACFNCGIVWHFEKVCQKQKRESSNRLAAISMEEECTQRVPRGLADPVKWTWRGVVKPTPRPLLHLEENAWILLAALWYDLTKWPIMNGLKGTWSTCRNLRWLTHKWCRWRKQCIGGQTAQPTGRENRIKYATSVIKWMRSSRKLQSMNVKSRSCSMRWKC